MTAKSHLVKVDLRKDERGAILLMAVFMSAFLVGGLWYIMGVGDAIIYRETVQSGADAAAFTGAVYHARGMNVIAMVNIVIGAVMAIAAASAMLMQIASVIISVATNMCDLSKLGVVTYTNDLGEEKTIDYTPLKFACDTIEPAKELMTKLKLVVAAVNRDTNGMLLSLSDAQREVAETAPWVGSAHASGVAAAHAPYVSTGGVGSPSMVPTGKRQGLPTQNEDFDRACQRSTLVLDKLVSIIVPAVLDPILEYANIDVVKGLPQRVCQGGNGYGYGRDMFNEHDVCKDKYGKWEKDENGHWKKTDEQKKCEEDMRDNPNKPEPVDLHQSLNPDDKSTKGMFDKAQNGNDYMQVYSAVQGQADFIQRADKGVEAANWWASAVAGPGSMNEDLGVAQAEFFYDQTNASSKTDTCWPQWSPCPAGLKWTTYKENTLWNLRWRARMTRYKSPTNVDVNVLTRTISPMTDYTAGVGPFNDSVGMGPKLINSTAVKDATGEAGFIGAGPAIIH